MLLLYLLFTTGSSAVVQSRILTTGFLAVALSLILSRDTLWWVTSSWMPRLHLQHQYSAPFVIAGSRWVLGLAVGARARWSCRLQQRVLLTMRTDLSFWSFGRFVAAAVRRWFPTPLRHHCVILWAVSTLITKAYIPASCHGVVRRFVRHRWRVIDPRVSLSSGFFLWSCHCHTLLPFTCAHDSLFCHRHLLHNVFHCGGLRLRVLFSTLLSCIARGLRDPRF